MSELFEFKKRKNPQDDISEQLKELEEEQLKNIEISKNELSNIGVEIDQVNEDYEETQEIDVNIPELSDDDLENLFGEDWDGSFSDMTGFVETYAQDMASKMQYISSVGEYLSSEKANIIDDISRRTGISEVKNNISQIQNNFNCLTNGITNFKTFGYSNNSSDILSNADSILSSVESMITNASYLKNSAEDIIKYMENSPKMIGELGEYFDKKFEEMTSIFSEENISNLMNISFPKEIIEKVMNVDVVQELYEIPKQLSNTLSNVMTSLNSIQAPTSLSSTLSVIKQLKDIVSQMRDVQDKILEGKNIIDGLKNNLSNGNYIGAFINVKNVSKFIEKSTSYAAKYPLNLAYETEGGHVFETDNTPDRERLHVKHKAGTDFEISPKGDVVAKIKNDYQTIVDKNFESHIKGDQISIIDNKVDISASDTNYSNKNNFNLFSNKMLFNSDTFTTLSKNYSVLSSSDISLSSNLETSISSSGYLYLTSKTGVIIDAPLIKIGGNKTSLISLNSNGTINEKSSTQLSKSGTFTVNAGMISLN